MVQVIVVGIITYDSLWPHESICKPVKEDRAHHYRQRYRSGFSLDSSLEIGSKSNKAIGYYFRLSTHGGLLFASRLMFFSINRYRHVAQKTLGFWISGLISTSFC